MNTVQHRPTETDVNRDWFRALASEASAKRAMPLQRGPEEILGTLALVCRSAVCARCADGKKEGRP